MGYFTETMALFEFKGDAEAAYAVRRAAEKMSGDHTIGKSASAMGKIAVNQTSPTGATTADDYRRKVEYNSKMKKEIDRCANSKSEMNKARGEFRDAANGKGPDDDMNRLVQKYKNGGSKGAKTAFVKESFIDAFDSITL